MICLQWSPLVGSLDLPILDMESERSGSVTIDHFIIYSYTKYQNRQHTYIYIYSWQNK